MVQQMELTERSREKNGRNCFVIEENGVLLRPENIQHKKY